LTRKRECTYT